MTVKDPTASDVDAARWGIEPVPPELRKLRARDVAVLWMNLGVGILVVITGGFLTAPTASFGFGMSLPAAVACIVLGSIIGCALLAFGGLAGSREGVSTMALMRPVLGDSGSLVPSVLNAAQLLGWTAFELWAMAQVADLITQKLLGRSSFALWVLVFAALALGLALWGPVGVVRRWMERFASWVLLVMALVLTVFLAGVLPLGELWSRPGASGGLIFGVPLDLVIVMPVSWLPLVADYNRFSKDARGALWGTFGGYAIANIWFYVLGAVFFAGTAASLDPQGLALGITVLAGVTVSGLMLMSGLLVGESDQAFANVYSAAMSIRNIFPKISNRVLVSAVTAIATAMALFLTMVTYELFLFLLGSVFVPLFGVWFADYFLRRNRSSRPGLRWRALTAWIAGFVVYHWIAPTPVDWWTSLLSSIFSEPLSTRWPALGASLPSFAVAFFIHAALTARPRAVE